MQRRSGWLRRGGDQSGPAHPADRRRHAADSQLLLQAGCQVLMTAGPTDACDITQKAVTVVSLFIYARVMDT